MTANGTVQLTWSHGKDTFFLGIGQILDLEEKSKAGLATILKRIASGDWYLNDVRETIRLGLIGGGRTPAEAEDIIGRHVVPPYAEHVIVAYQIIEATMVPPSGEQQPGKAEADRDAPKSTSSNQMDDSPDTPHTTSAQDSTGDQETLTQHPSGNSSSILRDTTPLSEVRPG